MASEELEAAVPRPSTAPGRLTARRDRNGNTTAYGYHGPWRLIDPDGNATDFGYDATTALRRPKGCPESKPYARFDERGQVTLSMDSAIEAPPD